MHGRALLDRVMCSNPSWDRKLNPIHGLTLLVVHESGGPWKHFVLQYYMGNHARALLRDV